MIETFITVVLSSLMLFTPLPLSSQEAVAQESNPESQTPDPGQQSVVQESEGSEEEAEPGVTLPEVIVEEEPLVEEGYKVESSTTATRTDTPLIDTPRSVGIVNRRLIDDRAIIDPQEAVQSVSGVQRAGGRTGTEANFIIRGFLQQTLIKDGFRAGDLATEGVFTFEGPTDLANIERIEVLKGPSAILYGRGEPGGVVNFITRIPTFENRFSLQQQIGNHEFYRTQLNANWTPVPGELSLRLDGAYENSESFIDFVEGERFFIAPALLWRIGENTSLTFRGEYLNDDRSSSTGFPVIDGRVLPGVPYSRYFGEPDDSIINFETWRGLLTLDHRWNKSHSTTFSLHGVLTEADGLNLLLFNFAGPVQDPNTGEISRIAEVVDFSGEYFTARLDHVWDTTIYTGNTSTSPSLGFTEVKNQLLISTEFDSQINERRRVLSGHTPLDPFDPDYTGYSPLPLLPIPGFPTTFRDKGRDEGRATSLLLIDRVSFGERVLVSFGGRYELFEAESSFAFIGTDVFGPAVKNDLDEDTFNPFVGLLVKPLNNFSLYAAYAGSTYSFQNIGLTTASGEHLDPERSRLFEAGVKAELLDGSVFTTLSLFQIDKRDVAGTDPDNPFFSINAGEERSRGVEVDVAGEPLPGLLVTANYAYIDAEITNDPAGLNTGNRLSGVPEHSGGLFATYEIYRGILSGLGLGGGVFVSDSVKINNANTGDLDGWAQTDVLLFYRRDHISLQVNVKNLFDEEFFFAGGGEGDATEVQRAASRTVIGSVRVEF